MRCAAATELRLDLLTSLLAARPVPRTLAWLILLLWARRSCPGNRMGQPSAWGSALRVFGWLLLVEVTGYWFLLPLSGCLLQVALPIFLQPSLSAFSGGSSSSSKWVEKGYVDDKGQARLFVLSFPQVFPSVLARFTSN